MCTPQLDHSEMFTELYREEKREEVTEVARRIKGESKGERQIQPIIRSLSVLHRLEHRDSCSWVEKRRGREETKVT